MRLKRRQRHQILSLSKLNLTPLIDTALTLLIIFMVAVPAVQNSLRIDLPKGKKNESTEKREPLAVHIDAQGKLHCDKKEVSLDQLIELVKKRVPAEESIIIRADEKVSYGQVYLLVDELKHVCSKVILAGKKSAPAA
jgi:biopolymer transport protein ExbD